MDDNANDKLGWVFGIKHELLDPGDRGASSVPIAHHAWVRKRRVGVCRRLEAPKTSAKNVIVEARCDDNFRNGRSRLHGALLRAAFHFVLSHDVARWLTFSCSASEDVCTHSCVESSRLPMLQ